MASKFLSRSSPTTLVVTAIMAGALGVAAGCWHYAGKSQSDSNQIRYLQAELRCSQYWSSRSGEADAEYRFQKGHRALLEVVGSGEWIDYKTPGVRSANPSYSPGLG